MRAVLAQECFQHRRRLRSGEEEPLGGVTIEGLEHMPGVGRLDADRDRGVAHVVGHVDHRPHDRLFAVVVLLMEIPSGYVADLLGRRLTLITGSVFIGLGHTMLLFAHDFVGLALFELGLGIGVSLVSGTDHAILYDTEQALGDAADRRQQLVGRLFTMQTASEALAALLCSALVLWSLELTVYVQVVVGWLPLLIAVSLVEPPGERLDGTDHIGNMRMIVRHLLKSGPVLRLTFLALTIWSLTTFYAVWLLQKLWQEQVSLANFGCGRSTCRLGRCWTYCEYRTSVRRDGGARIRCLLPAFGYLGPGAWRRWRDGGGVDVFVARGLGSSCS